MLGQDGGGGCGISGHDGYNDSGIMSNVVMAEGSLSRWWW